MNLFGAWGDFLTEIKLNQIKATKSWDQTTDLINISLG